jgi:hypothetical protein
VKKLFSYTSYLAFNVVMIVNDEFAKDKEGSDLLCFYIGSNVREVLQNDTGYKPRTLNILVCYEDADWTDLAQDRIQCCAVVNFLIGLCYRRGFA